MIALWLAAVGCGPSITRTPSHAVDRSAARSDATHAATSADVPSTDATVGAATNASTNTENTAASGEVPPFVPIAIQDPSGHALDAFHAALARAQRGEGQARIAFYGASHVASDLYTDVVRTQLQARFGDAGSGFVFPAKPFNGYRNAAIELEKGFGFRGVYVKAKAPIADRYGLAGAYLRARDKAASASFNTRAHAGMSGTASRVELYYLKQPHGGHLQLHVDGHARTIATDARSFEPGYSELDVEDSPHHVQIDTRGDGATTIFGLSLERATPGVVLDTLGIPGARVRYHLFWDDALYREHLARRHPDLVVLAYGTNESGDDDVPIASYENELRQVLTRVHAVVPQASCLLIGPSDRPMVDPDDPTAFSDRPRTQEIIAAQQRVAQSFGCGFFDMVAFMGGPLSMVRWAAAVPPLGTGDHIHFTRLGYEAMGHVLYDDLVAGYVPPSAAASTASPTVNPSANPDAGVAPTPALNALPDSPQSPSAAPGSTSIR